MSMTLEALAAELKLPFEGDGAHQIEGLASLDDAGATELSFATGDSYRAAFEASGAGAFLLPPDFESEARNCLRSPTPYADFARAVLLFRAPSRLPAGTHPMAVVAPDAQLGRDVAIGALAVIGARTRVGDRSCIHPHVTVYPGVKIGEDCVIHSGAHLREGVQLGDRVVVQSGAVVGGDGFGFTADRDGRPLQIPHTEGVILGDDVSVGSNTTVDASHPGQARRGRDTSATYIGPATKLDNLVQVGHGVAVGTGSILCAHVGIAGSTTIGRRVTFAGKAAAGNHLEIGDGAIIGGRSSALSSIEPGAQVAGHPAIDRRNWARSIALFRRLPDLFKRLRRIESQLGVDSD